MRGSTLPEWAEGERLGLKPGCGRRPDGSYFKSVEMPLDETVLSVDYKRLVPLLIKAVQELNAKVEQLEAELGRK